MARRGKRPACPTADRGRGVACPTCGAGVVRSFSCRRSHSAPAAWLPALWLGAAAIQLLIGCNSSHIPRTSGRSIRTGLQTLFQILFHLLESPLHRAPHGTLMDTHCPCYFGIALAEDHAGIHPTALRFV